MRLAMTEEVVSDWVSMAISLRRMANCYAG